MMHNLKNMFIPIDHELDLMRNMQGLKKSNIIVKEYMKEFHRIIIRIGHLEENKKGVILDQWVEAKYPREVDFFQNDNH